MRILLLGASGGCGRWVSRLAGPRGHATTAVVRSNARFDPPEGVVVRRANVLDAEALAEIAPHHDVVVSCLGPQRTSPHNPFSPLRPPEGIAQESARAIVGAMRRSGIRRLVAISAAGVGDSEHALPAVMKWLLEHSTIGAMYADLDVMESVYRSTDLEWTAVRPVTLVDAPPSRRTTVLRRFRTFSVVGRADVAQWLLDVAEGRSSEPSRTPMIGWW